VLADGLFPPDEDGKWLGGNIGSFGVDPDGNLLFEVTQFRAGSNNPLTDLYRLAPSGEILSVITLREGARRLAFAPDGTMYYIQTNRERGLERHALWRLDGDGESLGNWPVPESGVLSVDLKGDLYIVQDQKTIKLSPQGEVIGVTLHTGSLGFNVGPQSADQWGTYQNNRDGVIQKLLPSGELAWAWDAPTNVVHAVGDVYGRTWVESGIADSYLTVLSPDGHVLAQWAPIGFLGRRTPADRFYAVHQVVPAIDGSVYVLSWTQVWDNRDTIAPLPETRVSRFFPS
jgi:hypothetical protein